LWNVLHQWNPLHHSYARRGGEHMQISTERIAPIVATGKGS